MAADWKHLIAFLLLFLPAEAQAGDITPSFDCARARTADEQQICSDARLAELDRAIGLGFAQALQAAPGQFAADRTKVTQKDIRAAARELLADRHACGGSRICILDAQLQTISYLQEIGSNVPAPPWAGEYRLDTARQHPDLVGDNSPKLLGPKLLGHCTRTRIVSITDRSGETLKWPRPDNEEIGGTAVNYANGSHQVSYKYEEAVARSHVGDEVLMCLATIPRHCPPGDDRGRDYSTTVIETKRSWIMGDSQHICGGA